MTKYEIWRVQDWFNLGKNEYYYKRIIHNTDLVQNKYEQQLYTADSYIKTIQHKVYINGHNNIIAPYYDKLFIIPINEKITNHTQDEYYDMTNLRYIKSYKGIYNVCVGIFIFYILSIIYVLGRYMY